MSTLRFRMTAVLLMIRCRVGKHLVENAECIVILSLRTVMLILTVGHKAWHWRNGAHLSDDRWLPYRAISQ